MRIFNRNPTKDNLISLKILQARSRRVIRTAKKNSWRQYVSKLNSRTPIKQTWNIIRKIAGKQQSFPLKFLNKNIGGQATTPKEIANTIGETFQNNSSSQHYTPTFQKYQRIQEKYKINFKSQNKESYNSPFGLQELEEALHNSKDYAPGPDKVHYRMLKHLPDSSKSALLEVFNNIFTTGKFPSSWREAIVIPIAKPGKDTTLPENYRPIALTSCVCKTLEKMINKRLVWYLESNKLLAEVQAGFRKARSTEDQLVRFETIVREAFIRKQHVVAIFFDLEKAYDTTWSYGILKDLHKAGLRGHLPNFIINFLKERQFRVKIGSTLSDLFRQEVGVPQGSILSPTLFMLKINDITKCLNQGVDSSLYVDDFLISLKGRNMLTTERQLQSCLNKLEKWCNENGFKFSPTKTVCVHFSQRRGLYPDPSLTLNGGQIPVVDQTKFLGIIFDKKLSFKPHIQSVRAKCLRALNILKVVSRMDWGGDRTVLLKIYRSLIRSKLDYGSIVYGSARRSYLAELEPIANQSLKIALGAFRTSPIESLRAEANEPSLSLRREKLSLQYALRVSSNKHNPAHISVFEPNEEHLFQAKPNSIPPIGIRVKYLLNEMGFERNKVIPMVHYDTPPWKTHTPNIIFELCQHKKSDTAPEIFKSKFLEIASDYPHHKHIYTDGSKEAEKVGCAAIHQQRCTSARLPDHSSIFTAELLAIKLALRHIEDHPHLHFIIFSDSRSVLEALISAESKNPLVLEVVNLLHNLTPEKDIVFCWLPSHIGIRGNEMADKAAKEALKLAVSNLAIPSSDFRPTITRLLKAKWQQQWDNLPSNKLKEIKPDLSHHFTKLFSCRRDEVVLTRVRIGHSHTTHSYLLKGEERPECVGCQTPWTVKHILLECVDFRQTRVKYFQANTMKELFDSANTDNILKFLKEIHLYHQF